MGNPITRLRWVGWAEAVSFIVLLGIAMPLKYIWHRPEAVRVFGMLHGILFIAFAVALLLASRWARWPWPRTMLFGVMALIPFGPFLIDGRLRQEESRKGR